MFSPPAQPAERPPPGREADGLSALGEPVLPVLRQARRGRLLELGDQARCLGHTPGPASIGVWGAFASLAVRACVAVDAALGDVEAPGNLAAGASVLASVDDPFAEVEAVGCWQAPSCHAPACHASTVV